MNEESAQESKNLLQVDLIDQLTIVADSDMRTGDVKDMNIRKATELSWLIVEMFIWWSFATHLHSQSLTVSRTKETLSLSNRINLDRNQFSFTPG